MESSNPNSEKDESTDNDYLHIGVRLESRVIIETENHEIAQEKAQEIASDLDSSLDDENIELDVAATTTHFVPKTYE
jgi:hypothetical protein